MTLVPIGEPPAEAETDAPLLTAANRRTRALVLRLAV